MIPVMASTQQPITPGTDRWRELIAELARHDTDLKWLIGDAALEIAPIGSNRGNNGSSANLIRFSQEAGLGVPLNTMLSYRKTAQAWAKSDRMADVTWSVHRILTLHRHLIRPHMTVTDAYLAIAEAYPDEQRANKRAQAAITRGTSFVNATAKMTVKPAVTIVAQDANGNGNEARAGSPSSAESLAQHISAELERWPGQAREWLAAIRSPELAADAELSSTQRAICAAARTALVDLVPLLDELAHADNPQHARVIAASRLHPRATGSVVRYR